MVAAGVAVDVMVLQRVLQGRVVAAGVVGCCTAPSPHRRETHRAQHYAEREEREGERVSEREREREKEREHQCA